MERASGLVRRSYRETDLGSSSLLLILTQVSQGAAAQAPGPPDGALGRYLHTCSFPVFCKGTLSLLISYVTFAYKNTHRLSLEVFPLEDSSCVFTNIRITSHPLGIRNSKILLQPGHSRRPFCQTLFSQSHKEF